MRTLYLIRHGHPLTRESRTCGYSQDIPLSRTGVLQAEELRDWAQDKAITAIYSSPSLRCTQTAQILAGDRIPLHTDSALAEMDTGMWTGLSFDEIKRRWPVEYVQREKNMGTYPPPGGESFSQAGERMEAAVARLLPQTEGDIVIVSHSGISRGWLCRVLRRSSNQVLTLPQPCGGLTELLYDGAQFALRQLGVRPKLQPDQGEISALYERYATPNPVRAHCEAVSRRAMELADQTLLPVDRALLHAACLLHDLVRDWPEHAYSCGKILTREGYPALGAVIAAHHDLPEDASAEACLLYLADKLVQGTQRVSLDARFQAKRALCGMPKARAAWERRYQRAQRAAEQLGLDLTS